ncbi:MAG: zinc-ribbon domain-containing protein [Syntrophomonadaceae bacterium]|jgi:hypothetical protein
MESSNRIISPALFGIILICFLLPFMSVSCGGHEIGQVSGIELAFGTDLEGEDIDPYPPALFALAAAVIGLVISFWKKGKLLAALAGLGGFASLIALQLAINHEVTRPSNDGMIHVTWMNAYYLATILFIAVAVLNIYLLTRKPAAKSLPTGQDQRYCTNCGSANKGSSQFCTECGSPTSNNLSQ